MEHSSDRDADWAERQARLRDAYRAFLLPDRLLLSGHSHQAWPDVARAAHELSFDDAARYVDDKWERAILPLAAQVGRMVLGRMGLPEDDPIAFGESTHQLVYRLLSSLPPGARVVTTTAEFHSLTRQLRRLGEGDLSVTWVPAEPREGLADRLLGALEPPAALLAVSAVFYEDAYVLEGLPRLIDGASERGAYVLIDAYHAFNAVPLTWPARADRLFVTAGGYKYAAFGNGVCWLRIPPGCTLRPRYTGWFADFESLAEPAGDGPVCYGADGARFAGATFDPTALYRARAVLEHWDRFQLGVEQLREVSLRQTRRIIALADEAGLELVSPRDDAHRGAFVAVRTSHAAAAVTRLRARGIFVDSRRDLLRVGPAPYTTDEEIDRGLAALVEVLGELP